MYCRHVRGLKLQNVRIESKTRDPRPFLVAEDADALTALGVDGTPSGAGQAFLDLRNVRNVLIRGNSAPPNTGIYARISGPNSRAISFAGNDLQQAAVKIQVAEDVPPGTVHGDVPVNH